MFKNLVKVAAVAAMFTFAGVASAGPISASDSSAKAQATSAKASAKAAKRALKAYNKCLKRAAKGKGTMAACGGSSYSLAAPTVTAQATVTTSGPSCTSNCTQTVSEDGRVTGQATEVPEPTTLALIGASLLGMGFAARRRKLKAQV